MSQSTGTTTEGGTMKLFVFLVLFLFESHLASGQNGDPPEAPTDLRCLSQSLATIVCSWNPNTSLDTTYTVCQDSSRKCTSVGRNTSVELQFSLFKTLQIRIIANNSLGTQESDIFTVNESNIVFQPHTPRMVRVFREESDLELLVEWSDGADMYSFDLNLLFQIQVIQTQSLKEVGTGNRSVTLNPGHNRILQWSWLTEMPLQCTSHSVRVRCISNEPQYLFAGIKAWSDWSPWSTLDGEDVSNQTSNHIYPKDAIVLEAGTNMTFCCIAGVGSFVKRLTYHNYLIPLIKLSNRSTAIEVKNLTFLLEAGGNVFCELSSDITGAVIFVGSRPDVPQNLTCETRDLKTLNCTWDPGRFTGLTAERNTIYTLSHGSTSLTCDKASQTSAYYWCAYTLSNTSQYNISLTAENPLGKTQASISVNVTRVVHPFAPDNLRQGLVTADTITLLWLDPVNYKGIWLMCEIVISEEGGKSTLLNYSVRGESPYKSHVVQIDRLRANTLYTIRARYTSQHFWKWSEWSNTVTVRTQQAAPSVGVDVWRDISVNGSRRMVTLFWKSLSDAEANGPIESYTVTWKKVGDGAVSSEEAVSTSTELELDTAAYSVSVVARNSAGLSPRSTITIPPHRGDVDVEVERVTGSEGGFNLSWESRHHRSCGYTVQWCRPPDCQPEWLKLPSNLRHAVIRSDVFKPGVRYNFSVYECRPDGDYLLEEQVGYTKELAPTDGPEVTVRETAGDWIWLQWEDIPQDKLRGFIEGFNIYYIKSNASSPAWLSQPAKTIRASEKKIFKINGLNPGTTYNIAVSAFTGGGEGPVKLTMVTTLNSRDDCLCAVRFCDPLITTTLSVLSPSAYRIKESFYPDIPDPNNSKVLQDGNFFQGVTTCSTLEPRDCIPNEVQVVEGRQLAMEGRKGSLYESIPDDTSNQESQSQGVLSYTPQRVSTDTNLPSNTSGRTNLAFDVSSLPPSPPCPSQVTYSTIQSSGYQRQGRPGPEQPQAQTDIVVKSGYQPQIHSHTPPSAAPQDLSSPEVSLPTHCGYKPQMQPDSLGIADQQPPITTPIGSPTSVNSQTFLLAEQESAELPAGNRSWPLSSFFNT
uniref:Leukemia inhibitory factor receptor-like n=1 Tax=Callorhinchus milii TaxID=7868 RepID=A0A4W3JTR3_CALMI